VVGPSGSGKTTLLHVLAGIQESDEAVLGVGPGRLDDRPPWKRSVGLVVQDAMLFPLLDVRRNLCFGLDRATGRFDLQEVAALLEIGHLLDRRVRNLSGGEKQRVAIGRALLSEPELLLLDEPFAALDAPRRDRLIQHLLEIQQAWDLPIVLVSHHSAAVQPLVGEVFHLNEGRLVEKVGAD